MEILIAGALGVIVGMIFDSLILRRHYSTEARALQEQLDAQQSETDSRLAAAAASSAALEASLSELQTANTDLQTRLDQCEADRELAAKAYADIEELRTQVAHVSAEPQDLQRIEGIGPKIASVLNAAGIVNYVQLAAQSPSALRQILDDAGISRIANPSTWPQQASLAAAEKWDELDAMQEALHGGRERD
ncbi:MAG: DUF4332 domain-containing protein [Anaerolineae bacterium]|nr:DUF4332 domain-containing protein [Anaerolineae bacterium]